MEVLSIGQHPHSFFYLVCGIEQDQFTSAKAAVCENRSGSLTAA